MTLRVVAFYLPQYHPIELNDSIYGRGHTEWNQVVAARPLFRGHRQPVLPGELGFYDLRLPEVRVAQACLAQEYGVTAFCYWNYWSDGQRLMQRPLEDIVKSSEPDFPFCVGWANHDWHDTTGRTAGYIFKQRYPGLGDIDLHFRHLERVFHDPRYLTVHGKPLFYFFRPREVPDIDVFCDRWQELASQSGLGGVYFVGQARGVWDLSDAALLRSALDALVDVRTLPPGSMRSKRVRIVDRLRGGPLRFDYRDLLQLPLPLVEWAKQSYPCVITNWDSTPRWGRAGSVLQSASPALLGAMTRTARYLVEDRHPEERMIFVKSWNEWAEGNYLEPDRESGRSRLEAVAAALG
jgi:hypothetical protein